MQSLTIRRPDDWHVHLRDGDMLRLVAPFTARQFARAIVMPNLVPPVTTRQSGIRLSRPDPRGGGAGLRAADDLLPHRRNQLRTRSQRGFEEGVWTAAKLYPAGATTNSAFGVTDVRNIYPRARADAVDRHGACASTARSPIRTSTCSTGRRCSSTAY